MRIRITRATVAQPVGEAARAVEPGEEIEVDSVQGQQLLVLRKAILVGATAGELLSTPEDLLAPVEKRTAKGRK